jgi:lipopolysaccharide biosynthesis glycosyltransferase
MDSVIHVAMAADRGYKRQLAVSLSSLARTQPPGTCAVTVLHEGISRRDRDRIAACVTSSLELAWIEIDPRPVKNLHSAPNSSASFFRMMLPDLLPDLDRIIYLDCDIVVCSPLTELWQCKMGDAIVGAVRDAVSPWAAGQFMTHWRDLGLPPDAPYFNSGVLIIPLSVWRKEGVAAAMLDLLRSVHCVQGDQDALNTIAHGHWHELSRRWNVQTMDWLGQTIGWVLMREEIEAALADPAIIHYTTPGKPWWLGSAHPRDDLWFEHLGFTPWPEWRPRTRRAPWREAGRRAKHASRMLVKGV